MQLLVATYVSFLERILVVGAGSFLSCLEFPVVSAFLRRSNSLVVVIWVGLLCDPWGTFFSLLVLWWLSDLLFRWLLARRAGYPCHHYSSFLLLLRRPLFGSLLCLLFLLGMRIWYNCVVVVEWTLSSCLLQSVWYTMGIRCWCLHRLVRNLFIWLRNLSIGPAPCALRVLVRTMVTQTNSCYDNLFCLEVNKTAHGSRYLLFTLSIRVAANLAQSSSQ